jgi:hypothetical protein
MKLIAHRGFWIEPSEKNTINAFLRALQHGYGIETDFRDANGMLVVSHDPPACDAFFARDFFSLCQAYPLAASHALNIKADGLQALIETELKKCSIEQFFVFDMSVPDTIGYLQRKIPTFVRCSEYEVPSERLLELAKGVWLDSFVDEWYGPDLINGFLLQGKEVCVVSSELHKRSHLNLWASLKNWGFHRHPNAFLCTDFPLEAEAYFYE